MLQLDRYWSLDIWLDFSKQFAAERSNHMSWFRPFSSCFNMVYIFQVLCLFHIVERRLQTNGVFFMVVKHPKYKGGVAYFVAPPCWFWNPLLHNGFRLIFYLLFIYINFIDCNCHYSYLIRLFSHFFSDSNESVDLKVYFGRKGMICKWIKCYI